MQESDWNREEGVGAILGGLRRLTLRMETVNRTPQLTRILVLYPTDVHITKDGEIVMFHDPLLGKFFANPFSIEYRKR